jgi:hypothetical protein
LFPRFSDFQTQISKTKSTSLATKESSGNCATQETPLDLILETLCSDEDLPDLLLEASDGVKTQTMCLLHVAPSQKKWATHKHNQLLQQLTTTMHTACPSEPCHPKLPSPMTCGSNG